MATDESFLADRNDVASEFVRHRKEQIGSFLRKLFNKNPGERCSRNVVDEMTW